MFSPQLTEARIKSLFDAGFTSGRPIKDYSVDKTDEMKRRLDGIWDAKTSAPTREFTEEEAAFVVNERLLVQASFQHWATHYAKINVGGAGLRSMYPLLETQKFILEKLGEAEVEVHENKWHDGLLVNLLKGARQVGGSTLAEAIGAYKFTTQEHIFGLIAADVPETSAFMFDMFERMVEHLPWWLTPQVDEHVKDKEMLFSTQSHVWVGSGRSTRGTEGQRGQLGRGKTISFAHLSELSTWEEVQAYQIDGALMPAMPTTPRTFALFESTAKGRGNWWHTHWKVSREGKSRFRLNIFIPWYVEGKYALPAPEGWTPSTATLAHASHCVETSPRYLGHPVHLTRDQLYWYEFTRSSFEAKDNLRTFIEEYGSVTDDETFQRSGHSIFNVATQQRIRDQSRPILGMAEIRPQRELR